MCGEDAWAWRGYGEDGGLDAKLRDEDHSAFGFFASLPDITNTTLALAELSYALDVLKADGVTLFTRYGPNATYLGHPSIEPIWKARAAWAHLDSPHFSTDDSTVAAKKKGRSEGKEKKTNRS